MFGEDTPAVRNVLVYAYDRSAPTLGPKSSLKHLLKHVAARVPIDLYQRFMAYSILTNEFKQIAKLPSTPARNQLWDIAIDRHIGRSSKITYIEFGVHEGYSIKYFASKNVNPASVFFGLDSFEGLPEDWGPKSRGTFSVGGAPASRDVCKSLKPIGA